MRSPTNIILACIAAFDMSSLIIQAPWYDIFLLDEKIVFCSFQAFLHLQPGPPLSAPGALHLRPSKPSKRGCPGKQVLFQMPRTRKAPNMSHPQMLPPVPTRNMDATNMLKRPLPTIVLRNLKCFMTKLKSQKDMISKRPNRLWHKTSEFTVIKKSNLQ